VRDADEGEHGQQGQRRRSTDVSLRHRLDDAPDRWLLELHDGHVLLRWFIIRHHRCSGARLRQYRWRARSGGSSNDREVVDLHRRRLERVVRAFLLILLTNHMCHHIERTSALRAE
jgi:hypothetical protein